MPTQTFEFLSRADGGAETASRRLIAEPTTPTAQTGQRASKSISKPAECFEGISPEEVKMMMELMRSLVGRIGTKMEASFEQSVQLQYCTLMTQAEVAESCFRQLGAFEYIVKAVECRRKVLSLIPYGHVARLYHLATFGDLLLQRFMCLGDPADINEAIECRSRLVQVTPDGHPNKPSRLDGLGSSYVHRFECLGELADLHKAIECHTQAVRLTPDGHPDKPNGLNDLGNSYRRRFEHLGELADVHEAIDCHTQAVQLTPDGHPDKASGLNYLGGSYMRRFERLGDIADVHKAIDCQTQAVQLTPGGHPNKPSGLSNLGGSHMRRFERLGELADLHKAIDCQTQAVQLTPEGHPGKPIGLNNLGSAYSRRFERLGELADVHEAIECLTQAVQLMPDGYPEKLIGLDNLGRSYMCRFQRLGDLADVHKAIYCHTQAVHLTPDGHPDKPRGLDNLGGSYMCRFQRLGDLADVHKAIDCHTQAVHLTPDGHPDKPSGLDSLGRSHTCRFERLGELSDVHKAIECHTQALQLTPDGHPHRPSQLHDLGSSYWHRFERLGELADMDKAIAYHIQAVQLTPDSHPNKPSRLDGLGNSYRRRFDRLGDIADVHKAIDCHTQAVQLIPDDHPNKSSGLNNLGTSYVCRFERLGQLADVHKAIECQAQAVQLTPDDHPGKPRGLSNLGSSCMRRFERLGELADACKAIECQTQAVQLTPDGHPEKRGRLNNLGSSYRLRFERLGELADVHEAIDFQTRAVQLIPDDHPEKPTGLDNLGGSYMRRFQCLGELSDLSLAQSTFQHGAQLALTSPEPQLRCARGWAKASSLLGLSPQSAYERCFNILPYLIWLGTTINQRYSLLIKVDDLAAEAASWAISVHLYDLAIEWLEAGRSIVWNQILHLRTPFDQLSTVDSQLAQQLSNIASQLEKASSQQGPHGFFPGLESELEIAAQHHRHLAAEWERCLKQARNIPGFHNFMQPRSATELKAAATDGPIVIINTYFKCWDALILFPQCDDIVHVPLHDLPLSEDDRSHIQPYFGCPAGQRGDCGRGFGRVKQRPKPEDPLKSALVALWLGVVKPILDALGCEQKVSVAELPHVTWCATGSLASAPLHAAGPYDGSSLNAFDLVISSYTPSLGALLGSNAARFQSEVEILAVSQEYTKGHPPLPNTVQELEAIKAHSHAARFLQLNGKDATVDAVLNAMDRCSWVHLACHATQNPVNSTHSAFHLSDGDLTLKSITKRQFRNKGLAFLSACQTAKGDGELPDEAVHLAAGMLMAGYPSVIATMWSIWDADGPEVAGRVYAELLKDGKMDHREAARALHKAVASLREKIGEDKFERWVPFIHIGV